MTKTEIKNKILNLKKEKSFYSYDLNTIPDIDTWNANGKLEKEIIELEKLLKED